MPGGPGDLYSAAQELLEACAGFLEDAPGGPIVYQAVTQGLPPFDCAPALFVTANTDLVADTQPGAPAMQSLQRIVTTGIVNLVRFSITVVRCIATIGDEGQNIRLPSAAQLSEDARIGYGDAWAIWNGLVHAHKDGTLFPGYRCREFGLDPAQALRSAGGVGGWVLNVTVDLPGYDPAELP